MIWEADGFMLNVFASGIFGVIVGDAAGVPYEFKERDSFQCDDMVHSAVNSHGDCLCQTCIVCGNRDFLYIRKPAGELMQINAAFFCEKECRESNNDHQYKDKQYSRITADHISCVKESV